MREEHKTKATLIKELAEMRQRLARLETSEAERKRKERTRLSSEIEYSALIQHAKDGVVIIQDGVHRFANRAMSEISGYEVEVVDTTGAGDAFNGGLAVALAEGKELVDAIKFANATAALCVTKPGTAPSMPMRQEVEEFLHSR